MDIIAIIIDMLQYAWIALHVSICVVIAGSIPLGIYLMIVELVTGRQKTEWH